MNKKMRKMTSLWLLGLCFGLMGSAQAATQHFRLAAVEVNGVKFWLPSTLVVKKGDTVKIDAISKVPGPGSVHGLDIAEFKIQEVIDEKGKSVEFKADKVGIFQIGCHLHPPHIGGQLVVLP